MRDLDLKNADVIVMMYSIDSTISFNEIPEHFSDAKEHNDGSAIFVLVGNKVDLEEENEREVE